MISLYVGKPGTGKTYSLVREALRAIRAGKDVYSNFFIDFSKLKLKEKKLGKIFFWNEITELIPVRQGEILMDEAQVYMNSREWYKLDRRLQRKLQQHRKQGLNILGAVQSYKRIDTVARELVNSVYQVKRMGKLFVCREYDIEDMDKAKKRAFSIKIFWLNKKIANCYDTMYEIDSTASDGAHGFEPLKNILPQHVRTRQL